MVGNRGAGIKGKQRKSKIYSIEKVDLSLF